MEHTLPFDTLLLVNDRPKNVLATQTLGIESLSQDLGAGFDAARH